MGIFFLSVFLFHFAIYHVSLCIRFCLSPTFTLLFFYLSIPLSFYFIYTYIIYLFASNLSLSVFPHFSIPSIPLPSYFYHFSLYLNLYLSHTSPPPSPSTTPPPLRKRHCTCLSLGRDLLTFRRPVLGRRQQSEVGLDGLMSARSAAL